MAGLYPVWVPLLPVSSGIVVIIHPSTFYHRHYSSKMPVILYDLGNWDGEHIRTKLRSTLYMI